MCLSAKQVVADDGIVLILTFEMHSSSLTALQIHGGPQQCCSSSVDSLEYQVC